MRKSQHKQILDVLKAIKQAQDTKLYGDCQEAALSLCDFIEGIDGNKGPAAEVIALLLEYCELLFKVNKGEIGDKILGKHLTRIERTVTHKLAPNRIEMVFLSYKASMSDCLESIYLAAKADPMCDAYFIPIPYFEMLPNGQHGPLIYEGEEFYDTGKITVTHYRDYNIEARRPDAIFSFNPYDETNFITRVHSDYFCSKLANFTGMLVHVPYFFAVGANYELLVKSPGIRYSHKVILWLDRIQSGFINEAQKQFKGLSKRDLEDKFVILGSPKADKLVNSKKEDFFLPEEWAGIIEGKRVVLYNTSIYALINNTHSYLSLIEQSLEEFRHNPDVVLWWRPHPLMMATLVSMHVDLVSRYLRILNTYITEGRGILDETHDLHRAIAFSDAYFGDKRSSISFMCLVAGKPCMRTDFDENGNLTFDMRSINDIEEKITTPQDFISYILGDYAVSEERKSKMRAIYTSRGLDTSGYAGQKIYNHIKGCVQ